MFMFLLKRKLKRVKIKWDDREREKEGLTCR